MKQEFWDRVKSTVRLVVLMDTGPDARELRENAPPNRVHIGQSNCIGGLPPDVRYMPNEAAPKFEISPKIHRRVPTPKEKTGLADLSLLHSAKPGLLKRKGYPWLPLPNPPPKSRLLRKRDSNPLFR